MLPSSSILKWFSRWDPLDSKKARVHAKHRLHAWYSMTVLTARVAFFGPASGEKVCFRGWSSSECQGCRRGAHVEVYMWGNHAKQQVSRNMWLIDWLVFRELGILHARAQGFAASSLCQRAKSLGFDVGRFSCARVSCPWTKGGGVPTFLDQGFLHRADAFYAELAATLRRVLLCQNGHCSGSNFSARISHMYGLLGGLNFRSLLIWMNSTP